MTVYELLTADWLPVAFFTVVLFVWFVITWKIR